MLLGVGLVGAVAVLAAVITAIRLLGPHRAVLRGGFTQLVRHLRRVPPVDHVMTGTRRFVPGGYLALHLTLGLVLTATASVFIVLAEEVIGGGAVAAFDLAFARALRDSTTPGWERLFAVVSRFGERDALTVATLAVAVALVRTRGIVIGGGWVAAQAGGGFLNLALKNTFQRTRPEFADPLLAASSWSFPSGHAMGTFILCGLGCYLVLRETRSWTVAGIVITVSLSWCLVMAFSRLYLGVHFASDVVAGVVAGAAWVAVCASAFEVIRRGR